ncbi:hypothetical protein HOH45_00575 [bacterium]|jgi:hypothetical protein|nr:hypothetical protein [bacterium]
MISKTLIKKLNDTNTKFASSHTLEIVKNDSERKRCQELMASIYYKKYGVTLINQLPISKDPIERFPDNLLMAKSNGQVIGSIGAYLENSYALEYGNISFEEINQKIDLTSNFEIRELTKLVVNESFINSRQIGLNLVKSTLNSQFLKFKKTDSKKIVLICSKRSVLKAFFHSSGIKTHFLKHFPYYFCHSKYVSKKFPMEIHYIDYDKDIPSKIKDTTLPCIIC